MLLLEVQRVIAREGVDAAVRVLEHDITTHTGKIVARAAHLVALGLRGAAFPGPGDVAGGLRVGLCPP